MSSACVVAWSPGPHRISMRRPRKSAPQCALAVAVLPESTLFREARDHSQACILSARHVVNDAEEREMIATLRRLFGTSTVWGDLDAREARLLYRKLLPRVLASSRDPLEVGSQWLRGDADKSKSFRRLKTRATAAALARRAAKQYVRERSILPVRLLAQAVDGTRSGSPSGATVDELLAKYVDEARRSIGPCASPDKVYCLAYSILLQKSCETNRVIDTLLLDHDRHHADLASETSWHIDDSSRAWSAFLLACVVDEYPKRRYGRASYLRAKWLTRGLDRRLRRRLSAFANVKSRFQNSEQDRL